MEHNLFLMNKFFLDSCIETKELRANIILLAKSLGVNRVVFSNKGVNVKGTYNPLNNNMYIDTKQNNVEILHTFFHELAHHVAVLRNRWKRYHFNLVPYMNVDEIFSVENKIDKLGKKLWHKYVDIKAWGRYKYSYPKSQKNFIIKSLYNK